MSHLRDGKAPTVPPARRWPIQRRRALPPARRWPIQRRRALPPARRWPIQRRRALPPARRWPIQRRRALPPARRWPIQRRRALPPGSAGLHPCSYLGPAQRRDGRRWLTARRENREQPRRRVGDLAHGGFERVGDAGGHGGQPAHLADVLAGGGADFLGRRGWLEATELGDVAAHAFEDTHGCGRPGVGEPCERRRSGLSLASRRPCGRGLPSRARGGPS